MTDSLIKNLHHLGYLLYGVSNSIENFLEEYTEKEIKAEYVDISKLKEAIEALEAARRETGYRII